MGAMQNNPKDKGKSKDGRGSVKNGNRLEAFARAGPTRGADWGACDPALLQQVLVEVTSLGGAITLGLSRDKGAHSLTLLLDNNRVTLWFNGDADLDEELRDVVGTLEAMH